MGLGPPVCTDCKLFLTHLNDHEYETLLAEGILRPHSYRYICINCLAHSWIDYTNDKYGLTRDDPSVTHLWLLSEEEQKKYRIGL